MHWNIKIRQHLIFKGLWNVFALSGCYYFYSGYEKNLVSMKHIYRRCVANNTGGEFESTYSISASSIFVIFSPLLSVIRQTVEISKNKSVPQLDTVSYQKSAKTVTIYSATLLLWI